MKGLINLFVKDYQKEDFTRAEWMIGGVACFTLVAMCILAEVIDII